MDAQRWGSALPAHRHVAREENVPIPSRRVVSGVAYDCLRAPLAPTCRHDDGSGDQSNHVCKASMGLYFASDMISRYTPGVESAVISATECAQSIFDNITGQ